MDVQRALIRVEFRSRQLVVAANSCELLPDGRAKFSPCWLARFGGGAAAAVPTTVCCDAAYFTFADPVRDFGDFGSRKVLAVEPRGDVRIGFGPLSPTERARAEGLFYSRLREHGRLEFPQGRCSLTVRRVEGKKLVGPVLKRLDAEGHAEFVATAREGELRVDTGKGMLLLHLRSGVGESSDGSRCDFEERTFEVPLGNAPDDR
jgi:hypothetical protein